MARIVGIHGIGQQLNGAEVLSTAWRPAMVDGVKAAGGEALSPDDIACAFYGNLFRGTGKAFGEQQLLATDVSDLERELLIGWAAAAADPDEPEPSVTKSGSASEAVQWALRVLAGSRFFSRVAERLVIADLKQVIAYVHNDKMRDNIRTRVLDAITDDTRVLVGHSLGSVIAYEVLATTPSLPVRSLITLGSPLGIPNLIFDQLEPSPVDGVGAWPGTVKQWTNVADKSDVVALVKALDPLFDGAVDDVLVDNEALAHDATPYLTAEATGRAVAQGLTL